MATKVKPIHGLNVDFTNPLTRGLNGCFLFNEYSGNKVFDLVSRCVGDFNGCSWAQDGGIDFEAGTERLDVTNATDYLGGHDCVTLIAGITTTGASSYGRIVDRNYSDQFAFYLRTRRISLALNSDSDYVDDSGYSNPDLVDGEFSQVGFRWSAAGGLAEYFVNGIITDSFSLSGSYINPASYDLYFGNRSDLTRGLTAKLHYVYFFNCCLSNIDIYQLYVDPYQIIENDIIIPAEVATIIPIIQHHRQQQGVR